MSDTFAIEVFDPSLLLGKGQYYKRHVPADRVTRSEHQPYLGTEDDDEGDYDSEYSSPALTPRLPDETGVHRSEEDVDGGGGGGGQKGHHHRHTLIYRMFHVGSNFQPSVRPFSPKNSRRSSAQELSGRSPESPEVRPLTAGGVLDERPDPLDLHALGKISGLTTQVIPPTPESGSISAPLEATNEQPVHPHRPAILRVLSTKHRRQRSAATGANAVGSPHRVADSIHCQLQPSQQVNISLSLSRKPNAVKRNKSDGDLAASTDEEEDTVVGESNGPSTADSSNTSLSSATHKGDSRDRVASPVIDVELRPQQQSNAGERDGKRGSNATLEDHASTSPRSGRASPQSPMTVSPVQNLFQRVFHLSDDQSSNASSPGSPGDAHTPKHANGHTLPRKQESYFGANSVFKDIGNKVKRSRSTEKVPRLNRSNSEVSLSEKYGRCQEVLGEGAHAVVQLAHKKDLSATEKLYAVKRFRKRRKGEAPKDYIKKLTAEFCIASTLQHENICETVDLIQDENQLWCEVMEYCPGGDLYGRIKAEAMSVLEIDCFFKQLIQGVGYLHSVGVAHRDLKPENLLLDVTGHILKIADFGISEVFRTMFAKEQRRSIGLCGSEPYIATEEFTAPDYLPGPVDIWACAIVYYTMVYRAIPWLRAQHSDGRYEAYEKVMKVLRANPAPTATATATESSAVTVAEEGKSVSNVDGDEKALKHPEAPTSTSTLSPLSTSLKGDVDDDTKTKTTTNGGDSSTTTTTTTPLPPDPFSRLNPGAAHVIHRMLSPDPATRWTTQDIKCDRWFSGLECCTARYRNRHHGHRPDNHC